MEGSNLLIRVDGVPVTSFRLFLADEKSSCSGEASGLLIVWVSENGAQSTDKLFYLLLAVLWRKESQIPTSVNLGPREPTLIRKQDSASVYAIQEIKYSIYPLILTSDFQKLTNAFSLKILRKYYL